MTACHFVAPASRQTNHTARLDLEFSLGENLGSSSLEHCLHISSCIPSFYYALYIYIYIYICIHTHITRMYIYVYYMYYISIKGILPLQIGGVHFRRVEV